MNSILRTTLVLLTVLLCSRTISAQCVASPIINFVNPSFEGTPAANVTPGPWTECMSGQTPDTQPGIWGVTQPPTNGNSYLGLVAEPSGNWQEGAAEQLATPFLAGVSYTFTIDVANSSTTGGGIVPGCAELQIWGGFSACDQNTLLWSSGNITPYDTWQTYTVTFTPTQNFTWCMFQVNSLGCSSQPYILVDNIGSVIPSNVTLSVQPISEDHCFGDSTGKAVIHAVGQNPPFTYSWNSATFVTADSIVNNAPIGTYDVTVTDAHTCTATASVTITQPAQITLTPDVIQPACGGASTGSAYMSYAGGTNPFTFIWSNGPTTQSNPGLFDGTYNITATDSFGCKALGAITISGTPSPMTITGTVTNAHCGQSDGRIVTQVAGGQTPYTYLWNTTPAQTADSATGLGANTYVITVTDNGSCTASASFSVSQPSNGMISNLTVTNVLCFGQSTGAVASVTTGGSPPYVYLWSTTATTAGITNLAAGAYTVSISDQTGCGFILDTLVTQPTSPLGVTLTKVDVSCYGESTGSAASVDTGGTTPYTYHWNTTPPQTTVNATNLKAGSYNITVTDAHQCTATAATTINQPTALAYTQTQVNEQCFGDATGSATVNITGTTPPYTYSWNTTPAQTTATASNLTAGSYNLTVTDVNQCTMGITSTITQPTAIQATPTVTNVTCNGNTDGSITIAATGGTGAYTYQWSAGGSTTATDANLPAATYTATITDANNCSMALQNMVVSQPSALVLATAITNVSCPGRGDGQIASTVSGATSPYTYSWSNSETTANDVGLSGGSYDVTVTDANGCTTTATNLLVAELPGVSMTALVNNIICFPLKDGAISINATSSFMPLQYLWSNGSVSPNLTNIDTGTYTLTVTDAHNCSVDTTLHVGNDSAYSIAITPDTTINLGQSANVIVSPFGGIFATTTWTPSEGLSCNDCANPVASPFITTTYYVATIDSRGCTADTKVVITVTPTYDIFVPNVFTPNGDGKNDMFEVFGNKDAWKYFDIQLFDRWGEKVFESHDMNFGFDGQFKGKQLPVGVYVYQIHLVYLDNYTDKLFKGSVTLLR